MPTEGWPSLVLPCSEWDVEVVIHGCYPAGELNLNISALGRSLRLLTANLKQLPAIALWGRHMSTRGRTESHVGTRFVLISTLKNSAVLALDQLSLLGSLIGIKDFWSSVKNASLFLTFRINATLRICATHS